MKSVDINALHAKQLEILYEFDRICKKHGLTYFLAYGTLLGAVRHKGFIPWDDDIDTLMPYEDFKKLHALPLSEWNYPFFLQNSESDKNYHLCFSKVRNSNTTLITEGLAHLDINHGVDIDIYPLLYLADDLAERKKQYFNTKAYMLLQVNEPPVNHGRIYFLAGKIILSVIPKRIKRKMQELFLAKITQYKDTEDCYVVDGNLEEMHQVFLSSWFTDTVDAQFENGIFPIPVGAKECLRISYGSNYMELPPESKRGIKLDAFVEVDLNQPYTKYKGISYCRPGNMGRNVKNNRRIGKDG